MLLNSVKSPKRWGRVFFFKKKNISHDKMVYECDHCGYFTIKKSHFLIHKKRINFCGKNINGNNNIINNISPISENVVRNFENVVQNFENVVQNFENVVQTFSCNKCKKILSNKYILSKHELICKGVCNLTCNVCLLKFENREKKYRHKKKRNCHPPPPPDYPSSVHTINNVTNKTKNYNNSNNTTNNNTRIENQNNNNIQINVFGKEDLDYLLKDPSIIQKLKSFGKSGIYGLPKILNDIHFNKDKPENSTLIKPEEYGNGVMIMNDEKEWEYREFEDIRDNLINTIIKYFHKMFLMNQNVSKYAS